MSIEALKENCISLHCLLSNFDKECYLMDENKAKTKEISEDLKHSIQVLQVVSVDFKNTIAKLEEKQSEGITGIVQDNMNSLIQLQEKLELEIEKLSTNQMSLQDIYNKC